MSGVTTISTHVLDTALGKPASGITVRLEHLGAQIASAVTNADGRAPLMGKDDEGVPSGRYRVCFGVAEYFARTERASFYDEIVVDFLIAGEPQHYHIPLLLSPYGYATYRGS